MYTRRVAAVQYIIGSVIDSLLKNPNRRVIYVEQAFFQRWWRVQTKQMQKKVKKLVESGQLEFINGGWCMHDEATTHYVDMIDQTTLGHRYIKKQFDVVPRIGWQIDPFGHSAVQGYLLGAEVGFDAVFFGRADYQDKLQRQKTRTMEFIWRGSKSLGSSAQIFGGLLGHHDSAPEEFRFDTKSTAPVIQDDPLLYDYNVEERVELFVKLAREQAAQFRTNHIMWTMGEDFAYEYAETWFKQMDKLVHYGNKDFSNRALQFRRTLAQRPQHGQSSDPSPTPSHPGGRTCPSSGAQDMGGSTVLISLQHLPSNYYSTDILHRETQGTRASSVMEANSAIVRLALFVAEPASRPSGHLRMIL
ncbi:hypothetical protein R1flu_014222 [Riccia fluitans]|uniref:Glycoside hydrolase family 38 N-terminal domain-containing protein n=1 Tax=Riccia fluitans TaxID=41844 RepID=A0ABD1YFH4_9MARC